ncbi:hypothetical protein CCY99_04215 [Helicobacter sp. 16-1353]|uniref:alpha/beta fold hydrolase n=1 Tax=Helicobacter sp. 16-1353 TaxID=2004996 RepID=UPI000DCEFC0E|nr:alpha/beta hydrolase [Helicobacter sp. 16-1353]RAX54222.1 hypothetical protein CCY99_04215 [Helicobacter sp. 16-1353]
MALKHISLNNMEFDISYIMQNNKKDSFAVFLHGWGANKELMQDCFKESFKNYNHLYIDLPGFGNSSNSYILDSNDYRNIIESFLIEIDIKPTIIIGHSFGGKIATLLNPKILVLLSSAGIPKVRSLKTKIKIRLAKICNFFGVSSRIFRTKDALNLPQNMYEILKIVIKEDFSDIFGNFHNKAFIFWGENDYITPLYMANKIHSVMKHSKLYVLEGDHYFFLHNANKIDRIVNGNDGVK